MTGLPNTPRDEVSPTEIKPCPFCGYDGAEETIIDANEGIAYTSLYRAACRRCDFALPGSSDYDEALAQWNRRSVLPDSVGGSTTREVLDKLAHVSADIIAAWNGGGIHTQSNEADAAMFELEAQVDWLNEISAAVSTLPEEAAEPKWAERNSDVDAEEAGQ